MNFTKHDLTLTDLIQRVITNNFFYETTRLCSMNMIDISFAYVTFCKYPLLCSVNMLN